MDGLYILVALGSLIGWFITRYSIWCLPFVVSVAILAEDDFYPLSHFPMYSDPDESENYLYVATYDSEPEIHEAIPIHRFTGLSAPKVKKMWKSYSRDFADDLDKKDTELTSEEKQEIGGTLLEEFREVAATRGKTMPDNLALVEIWIEATPEGGWSETPEVLSALPDIRSASEASDPETAAP